MPGPKLNEAPVRMRNGGRRGDGAVTARASVHHTRTSAWKMRVVLDLIRGHSVTEAANILRFCERDAATDIAKLLQSAVANAENNDGLNPDELYVSSCYADEGRSQRRWSPRARGRADRVNKYSSHVVVIVSRMPADQLALVRARGAEAAAQRARRTAGTRARAEQGAGDARRVASGTSEQVAGAVMPDTPANEPAAEYDPGADREGDGVTREQQLVAQEVEAESAIPHPAEVHQIFTPPDGVEPDALDEIEGIGPRLAETLNALGIITFDQLADLTEEDVEELDGLLPRSSDQIRDWRAQAQAILDGIDTEND